MTRLAYGVVAGRGLGVWAPGPEGAALVGTTGLSAGAPVVIGPRRAAASDVTAALAGLTDLVDRGAAIVAGADIDLGGGFRTARLAGGAGDRRDAVLAALRVLGTDGAARLGDRAAVLVALFGPAATKRVGAAATAALHDGRWVALRLASAASDLLGPEQVERVLALDDPHEAGLPDDESALASALAVDLDRVLAPLSRPRRLTLLLDLWDVVVAQHAEAARRTRLRELRGGDDLVDQVREKYQRLVDEEVSDQYRGQGPAQLVRSFPTAGFWHGWLVRTMRDALAATVLLRAAVAVASHGVEGGMDRVRRLVATGPDLLTRAERTRAGRRTPELPMAARPGVYVYELYAALPPPGVSVTTIDARRRHELSIIVHKRLSLARAYGVVVLEAASRLLEQWVHAPLDLGIVWPTGQLRGWREAAGYTELRAPHEWTQPVLAQRPLRERQPGEEGGPPPRGPLAQRLRDQPAAGASDVETLGDLLWFAELADALAQVDGYDAALVEDDEYFPLVSYPPPVAEVEPLRPADDSVPAAVAGAAQLVELGAQAPDKPRTWTELVDGLMASTAVAETLTGAFAVPQVLLDRDGAPLPDAPASEQARPGHRTAEDDLVVEVARDPHQLVAWARYMGNCISGPYYLGEALRGRTALVALRTPGGRLVANAELRPHRSGWRLGEIALRFNHWPSDALDERVRVWVGALPPAPVRRGPAPTPRRARTSEHRPYRPNQDLAELRRALVPLAARAMDEDSVGRAAEVMARVGRARASATDGVAGLTALRRLGRADLDETVRQALTGGVDLTDLWRATAVRPLAAALDALDPGLRDRTGSLGALLGDAPLPALARRLARTQAIAQARTVEVVARRLRRSLGRLACADDPVLAPLVPRRADPGLLCALVLAVSAAATTSEPALTRITRRGGVAVPGHPASTVDDPDGPWRRARVDAVELGADLSRRVPPALLVPTSWLGRGGWPVLWERSHRVRRS